jgi:hypothetical protein
MTRNTCITTILLLTTVPLAVLAADPKPASTIGQAEAPPLFKELDKNHDGQIDQAEAKKSADVTTRFMMLDTSKDKRISVAEWLAGEQPKSGGAAGVSGTSREPGAAQGQSAPSKPGEGMKPLPDKY